MICPPGKSIILTRRKREKIELVARPEVGVLPQVVPVSTVPPGPVLSHDEGGAEVSILGKLGGNPQAVGSRVTEAVVYHATSRCAQPRVIQLSSPVGKILEANLDLYQLKG